MTEASNLAKHTVSNDDTLSALALKYYGSTAKEDWMRIYEANKDVIGANPNVLRPGIVLTIPQKTAASPAPQPPASAAKTPPKNIDQQ